MIRFLTLIIVLLHTLASPLAAGAVPGSAGGVAASLHSGAVDGTAPNNDPTSKEYKEWKAGVTQTANMIGATVGYVLSGSEAANVNATAAITQSGVENNYLTHAELAGYQDALRECMASGEDCSDTIAYYERLSAENNDKLLACGSDAACMQEHITKIAAAEVSGKADDILKLLQQQSVPGNDADDFLKLQYEVAENVGAPDHVWSAAWQGAGEQFATEFMTQNCSGLSAEDCVSAFNTELERIATEDHYRAMAVENLGDFAKGVGTFLLTATTVGSGTTMQLGATVGRTTAAVAASVRATIQVCGRSVSCYVRAYGAQGTEIAAAVNAEFAAGGAAVTGIATVNARVLDDIAETATRTYGDDIVKSLDGGTELATYYPPNRGFLGDSQSVELPAYTQFDRYGSDFGTFVAPVGTPEPMRALPPGTADKLYSVFETMQPITVQGGTTAPAFNQLGLGTQYELPMSVKEMLEAGLIIRVK